jgi:dUTP pyrophosphatase
VIKVLVHQLDPDLPLPSQAHPGDAGLDLYAAEDIVLAPGARASVGTGIAVAIPERYAGLVMPRSGLAARHGISIVNAPGLIDSGYRGEIRVVLVNLDSTETFKATRGERIAQLVIQRAEDVRLVPVDELPESTRGGGGFGSTGV